MKPLEANLQTINNVASDSFISTEKKIEFDEKA